MAIVREKGTAKFQTTPSLIDRHLEEALGLRVWGGGPVLPLAPEPSTPEEGLTRVNEHLVAQADFFLWSAHLGPTQAELVNLEALEAAQVSGCGQECALVGGQRRLDPTPIPAPSSPVHPLRGSLVAEPRASSTDTRDAQSARSSRVMTPCFLTLSRQAVVLSGALTARSVPCS